MFQGRKLKQQAGYSLIELMVTLATMLVISAASFALISSSLRFSNSTYHLVDAQEGLRASHEIIHRDLTTAGDGLTGIGTITVPLTFVQNYLTQDPVVDPSTPDYVNLALVTSDDNVAANTAVPQTSPAVNVLTGSDRLTMLTRDYEFNTGNGVTLLAGKITVNGSNTNLLVGATNIGKFQNGELYAIVSQNSAAFGVVTNVNTSTNTVVMGNADGLGLNQTGVGTPVSTVSNVVSGISTQNVTVLRFQIVHYFVNSNNLLIRRIFGVKGGSFVDSVVAEHVTSLNFRYLLNLTDANGFVQQPKTVLTTSQEQIGVRQVETSIGVETVRTVNAVTNVNASSNGVCGGSANGKQIICSTTSTTVRNLQFRQALSP
jgi:Tfp pilus assembly protein PilW